MKKAIIGNLIPALLAIIVFCVSLPFYESAARLFRTHTRAVEWDGVRVITPTVGPGGVLELAYRAKINKQCPSDLQGFLIEEDGSVPVRLPLVAGGYRPPGDDFEEIRVKIQVPFTSDPGLAPLRAGKYTYRAIATRYCTEGVEQDREIPDATFIFRQSVSRKGALDETASMVP